NNGLTHSQTLLPMAQAVLENTKITGQELDCIAVAAGPGSFTGVRIGIAAVKGLAMALDKPCAPVSTLAAMAALMPYRAGTVCAVMDARCAQVYNALFALQDGKIQRLTPDRAVPVAQLRDELAAYPGPIFLVGDGAEL